MRSCSWALRPRPRPPCRRNSPPPLRRRGRRACRTSSSRAANVTSPRLAPPGFPAAKSFEDRERARHGEVASLAIEGLRVVRHHVAVQHAREYMQFQVLHARGRAAIGGEHLGGRLVVRVAPDDADGPRQALELPDVVEHLRAVAGDARVVAQALRPEDRVGPAVAQAHHGGAPVPQRLLAKPGEHIGEIGFTQLDFREARLRALLRTLVVARERPRDRAPEQIGRRREKALRGELVGDRANVRVHAVHGGSDHDRRSLCAGAGRGQIAIELAPLARTDPDVLALHIASSPLAPKRRSPYSSASGLSNLRRRMWQDALSPDISQGGLMRAARPTFGAFNQGGVPTIACFNKAATPLGVDFDALIAAMQAFVDQYVMPVWGTPAKLVKSKGYVKGAWAVVFLDNADQPGALAYHDLTPDGLPQSKVFVKTTLDNHDLVSVSASHELVEMLVDPAINIMTTGPDPKVMYAYESADPVEQLSFKVDGIPMTDFVYPAYFEVFHKAGSVRFDQMKKVNKPFQILSGGYQIVFKNGKWSQIFASVSKKRRFGREDRRGHRSEQRVHAARNKLRRADKKKIARWERRI